MAKRSKRFKRPPICPPLTRLTRISRASFRLWNRNPSWMLIACFAMFPPGFRPEPPGSQELSDVQSCGVGVPGVDPGHVRLLAEPGQLALGEAAGRSNRLLDRVIEARLPSEVLGELTVTDRLERWPAWIRTGFQKCFDLSHPPRSDHRRHSARDAIVQDGSRERQSDEDRVRRGVREGAARDPPRLRAAAGERHLERAKGSLRVPFGGARGRLGIERAQP